MVVNGKSGFSTISRYICKFPTSKQDLSTLVLLTPARRHVFFAGRPCDKRIMQQTALTPHRTATCLDTILLCAPMSLTDSVIGILHHLE